MKKLTTADLYPIRIGHYRKQRGLTQPALAKLLHITREHLSRIENGRSYLTESMESQISYHLKLSSNERLDVFGFPGMTPSTNSNDRQKGAAAQAEAVAPRLRLVPSSASSREPLPTG